MRYAEKIYTRREFIRSSACAAVGTASLYSTMMNLRQVNAAALNSSNSAGTDYKALVCVFLYGGNDAANVLIPRDDFHYPIYAAARQNLAIPRDDLLPLNAATNDGREYGLHPSLGDVQALFNEGKIAFISNVGTLIAPVTLEDYRNRTAALPPNLFSHNDQQVLWQTSVPHSPGHLKTTGWGGRIADLLHAAHNTTSVSMNISLLGSNVFQVGDEILPYRISSRGSAGFDLGKSDHPDDQRRFQTMISLFGKEHANLMEDVYADITNRAVRNDALFSDALAGASPFPEFPQTNLGRQMQMTARVIEKRAVLGMRRQIFFCATGGYDTHGEQLNAHAGLLQELDDALAAFNSAMESIGVGQEVTTFTASDFGRTFVSNGRGSDHAWGSHHIVMGSAVKGKQIYGTFPTLDLSKSPDDVGNGRFIPTTSVDQYASTLACWFGVNRTDLNTVFPNIGNFATADLGFMKTA